LQEEDATTANSEEHQCHKNSKENLILQVCNYAAQLMQLSTKPTLIWIESSLKKILQLLSGGSKPRRGQGPPPSRKSEVEGDERGAQQELQRDHLAEGVVGEAEAGEAQTAERRGVDVSDGDDSRLASLFFWGR
jgi:hypothetical protein